MMKFEFLPNEIFIECFEYLNIFDRFHSFDQLNSRFYSLIRNIPSHLDFQQIHQTKFDYFCRYLLPDPSIQQHIYSLRLSNKGTCGQIQRFFSSSSNSFLHLHSLTLIHIEQENLFQLKSLLPTLSELYSLHFISPQIDDNHIISILPMANLQRLSLLTLRSLFNHIQQPTVITHLTIYNCSLEQLEYQLFHYVPLLKYLNIEQLKKYNRSITNNNHTMVPAMHLKQLIIKKFHYNLIDFQNFVQQIPNLQSLTIDADENMTMIDAKQWKILIKTSLPRLKTFKFKFSLHPRFNNLIKYNYGEFQRKFWHRKLHCYTQVISQQGPTLIYTIPYLSNSLDIRLKMKRTANTRVNNSNGFDKITDLTLNHGQLRDRHLYCFSNVRSLKLITSERATTDDVFTITEYIEKLKIVINLSNLKHLDLSKSSHIIRSGELLDILKESRVLSSITIDPNDLILIYENDQLCQYLNKMIKKLNIYKYNYYSFHDHNEWTKFCQVFSNIEQLICSLIYPHLVMILLDKLSKLAILHVYFPRNTSCFSLELSFEQLLNEVNFNYRIEGLHMHVPELRMWIDRKIN